MVGLQAVSVRCLDQTVVREATPRDEKHMYFFFNTRNKADNRVNGNNRHIGQYPTAYNSLI